MISKFGLFFSLRRNIVSDGAVVVLFVRLYESLGSAVANDRSPTVTQFYNFNHETTELL